MTRLTWIARSEASALHAAAALIEGRTLVDTRLAAALAEPAAQLAWTLRAAAVPPREFFLQAIPRACRENNFELAEFAAQAAGAAIEREISPSKRDALAAALAELFAEQDRAIPDLARQLAVRSAPLAEQWEARGPGLLARIGRLTKADQIPAEVGVALVYPALGGGGAASPLHQFVWIEAVLANPHPEIPEVVRLGWLIAQAGFRRLPTRLYSTPVQHARLAAVALAPAALEAAEHVELARFDTQTLQLALDVWGLASSGQLPPIELLQYWWRETRDWTEMLFALDIILKRGL